MKHPRVTVWTVLIVLGVVMGLLLTGCENLLGDEDDSDNEEDNGEVVDPGDGDPSQDTSATSWMHVSVESLDHPFGGSYRVAIIDISDSLMKIIFYDEAGADGVLQVAGGILPYETDSEEITFEWSHAWLGSDPEKLEITYTGRDWYEIPSSLEAPSGGTMQINGDTLTVNGGAGALEFSKVEFGLPAELVESWDLDVDGYTGELILGSTSDAPEPGWGSLSYTWNEPDDPGVDEQIGSGYWRAIETSAGFFRQVYTKINIEEGLEYWEHLTPYAVEDSTLTFYADLNRTEAGAYSYQCPQ